MRCIKFSNSSRPFFGSTAGGLRGAFVDLGEDARSSDILE